MFSEADLLPYEEELTALLLRLCQIPAPSLKEDLRAEFCRDWLARAGFPHVFVDGAKNVVCPMGVTDSNDLTLFMAHTDTVFPDTEPFVPHLRDGKLYCPGAGDDTANLAVLLMAAKLLRQTGKTPRRGMVFVANAAEEGLGNLKGCRNIMETYGERIKEVVSFDLSAEEIYVRAVGSARYRITLRTEGGHSYRDFGNRNAIHQISRLVNAFYEQSLPAVPSTHTTYNVGMISGGTSVNTVAESAELWYEYRSDSNECLAVMERQMQDLLARFREEGLDLSLETVGLRPGMGLCRDPEGQAALIERAESCLENAFGVRPARRSGSTDCNIPFSLGIPSVCFGLISMSKAHTRGEWVDLSSLPKGLAAALNFLEFYTK